MASYGNSQYITRDLSTRLFEQVFFTVEHRIALLFDGVARQDQIIRAFVARRVQTTSRLSSADFPWMLDYLYDVMQASPRLWRLSVRLANGEYCHVMRHPPQWRPNGLPLSVQKLVLQADGRYTESEYWCQPNGEYVLLSRKADVVRNVKAHPHYAAVLQAGREIWTDAHMVGGDGEPLAPGITFASPIRGRHGSLLGVVSSTLRLDSLQQFLGDINHQNRCYSFLVEINSKGERHVIAESEPLAVLEEVADVRVRAVSGQMQPGESRLRPVHLTAAGEGYSGAVRDLTNQHGLNWIICVLMRDQDLLGAVWRHNRVTVAMSLVFVALAVVAGVLVSSAVARPMAVLSQEAEAVGKFMLEQKPIMHSSVIEVDRLAVSVEDMKRSLRSFQKYVPSDLVRAVLSSGQEAELGGERRDVTIFFSDIAGFTTLAETLPPERLVELLGQYLGQMSGIISACGGTVDKYIGDAVMAFWGAPAPHPQAALAACQCALQQQAALAELRERWGVAVRIRIGIHSGDALVGNFGSASRLDYTAIGDNVNLASRLEGLNKHYGTGILLSEATLAQAGAGLCVREIDRVSVQGRTQGVLIYELMGVADAGLISGFQDALHQYWRREFSAAAAALEALLRDYPRDGPTEVLLRRCRACVEEPPPEPWDGIWHMKEK